jgi:uncharacterized protein YbjT (DUF2867 family)
MEAKRTIVVAGATGAQGGGLARAILEDPERMFGVRALTRNAGSDKALKLADAGAEVVEADFDDLQSLKQAFDGAYGAWCVTNFWEHFSPERELAQAENLAEASRAAGVEHVVWSTLEDTRRWVPLDDDRMPTLMGHYKVPHFDAKGEADRCFTERGLPATFLLTSFYWDNLIHLGAGPERSAEGVLAITFPMGREKMPGIASEDIGKCAFGIFRQKDEYLGRTVGIAGEHLTGDEMAAALSEILGEPVRYDDVSPQTYRSFGFPGAEDLANMYQFMRDFNRDFCGVRDVELARALNPSLQSFRDWLASNRERLPLE